MLASIERRVLACLVLFAVTFQSMIINWPDAAVATGPGMDDIVSALARKGLATTAVVVNGSGTVCCCCRFGVEALLALLLFCLYCFVFVFCWVSFDFVCASQAAECYVAHGVCVADPHARILWVVVHRRVDGWNRRRRPDPSARRGGRATRICGNRPLPSRRELDGVHRCRGDCPGRRPVGQRTVRHGQDWKRSKVLVGGYVCCFVKGKSGRNWLSIVCCDEVEVGSVTPRLRPPVPDGAVTLTDSPWSSRGRIRRSRRRKTMTGLTSTSESLPLADGRCGNGGEGREARDDDSPTPSP